LVTRAWVETSFTAYNGSYITVNWLSAIGVEASSVLFIVASSSTDLVTFVAVVFSTISTVEASEELWVNASTGT
jgi:hypothetical protein